MTGRGKTPHPPAGPATVVRPIRPGIRARKKPRPEDEAVINAHLLVKEWQDKSSELARSSPGSREHEAAINVVGALRALQREKLRCIVSTLDEERDFELRCAELEILRAEHALEAGKSKRLRLLGGPGAETCSHPDSLRASNRRWERVVAKTIEMAETPARTRRHLDTKRHLVGRVWLGATGQPYDRMRAGIAADEAWLAQHAPGRTRRAR